MEPFLWYKALTFQPKQAEVLFHTGNAIILNECSYCSGRHLLTRLVSRPDPDALPLLLIIINYYGTRHLNKSWVEKKCIKALNLDFLGFAKRLCKHMQHMQMWHSWSNAQTREITKAHTQSKVTSPAHTEHLSHIITPGSTSTNM